MPITSRATRRLTAMLALSSVLSAVTPAVAAGPDPLLAIHAERDGRTALEAVEAVETMLGRPLDLANVFHGFNNTWLAQTSPNGKPTELEEILASGHALMISWRATDSGDSKETRARRAADIAAGAHDDTLVEMGESLARLNGRVLVRFQWEMDQNAPSTQYIGTPTEFIAAWRHVHDVVSALAPDVEWVWAPRANSFNKDIGQQFWPGAAYVDWISGSAVPIASSGKEGTWRSAQDIFEGAVAYAAAQQRPFLLWIGVREKMHEPGLDADEVEFVDDPAWKARFVDDLLGLVTGPWRGKVGAVMWYHSVSPLGYDFRLDTSDRALRSARGFACHPVIDPAGHCAPAPRVIEDPAHAFPGAGSAPSQPAQERTAASDEPTPTPTQTQTQTQTSTPATTGTTPSSTSAAGAGASPRAQQHPAAEGTALARQRAVPAERVRVTAAPIGVPMPDGSGGLVAMSRDGRTLVPVRPEGALTSALAVRAG